MLMKLMKHELRATGRIMLPLFLLVLISAVGANISTRTMLDADSRLLNTLGIILMFAFVIAICAVCIVAFILMIQRFYKNLLQDEGYVMMTLPVSVHQHIISKLLVSMLWFVLTAIVVFIASMILAYEVGFVSRFFYGFKLMFEDLANRRYLFDAVIVGSELLVMLFFGAAASCLNFYLALAIGHSFSSKKLLMSIVAFFVIQFINEIIGVMFIMFIGNSTLGMTAFMDSQSGVAATQFLLLTISALCIAASALFYCPTAWLLKNRLNLE